jgi:hypothetical protein
MVRFPVARFALVPGRTHPYSGDGEESRQSSKMAGYRRRHILNIFTT